jgi:hypothetical protein
MTDAGLAERIRLIEDRAAIADLVHLYARAMRYGRPADAMHLFTEDGVFEIRDGLPTSPEFTVRTRLEGRIHIDVYLVQRKGGAPAVCPLIHNLLIEVDGDTARASSVMETQMLDTGRKTIGEYDDRFRREDGTWKFAARTYTIFKTGAQPG